MKLSTGSEFHFPTFKVTVVALVARISDPQVVSAKSRLMFDPEEDAIRFLYTFAILITLRSSVVIFSMSAVM